MKVLALNCSSAGDDKFDNAFRSLIEKLASSAEISQFTIRDLDIRPCYSCTAQYSYQYDEKCRCDDDMNKMYSYFKESDVWIFAVKVAENGALKYLRNLLDRMEPLFQPIYFLDNSLDFSAAPEIKLSGAISGFTFYEPEFEDKALKIVDHLKSVSVLFDKNYANAVMIESGETDTIIGNNIDELISKLLNGDYSPVRE